MLDIAIIGGGHRCPFTSRQEAHMFKTGDYVASKDTRDDLEEVFVVIEEVFVVIEGGVAHVSGTASKIRPVRRPSASSAKDDVYRLDSDLERVSVARAADRLR